LEDLKRGLSRGTAGMGECHRSRLAVVDRYPPNLDVLVGWHVMITLKSDP